jgi:hypothetical protein
MKVTREKLSQAAERAFGIRGGPTLSQQDAFAAGLGLEIEPELRTPEHIHFDPVAGVLCEIRGSDEHYIAWFRLEDGERAWNFTSAERAAIGRELARRWNAVSDILAEFPHLDYPTNEPAQILCRVARILRGGN